jgi:hypothetical protein
MPRFTPAQGGRRITHVQVWIAADVSSAELWQTLLSAVALRLRVQTSDVLSLRLFRDGVLCALSAGALLADCDSLVLDITLTRAPAWWRAALPELAALASLAVLLFLPWPPAKAVVLLPLSLAAAAVHRSGGLVGSASTTAAAWSAAASFAAADISLLPAPFSAFGFLLSAGIALWRSRVLLLSTVLLCLGALLDRARRMEHRLRSDQPRSAGI